MADGETRDLQAFTPLLRLGEGFCPIEGHQDGLGEHGYCVKCGARWSTYPTIFAMCGQTIECRVAVKDFWAVGDDNIKPRIGTSVFVLGVFPYEEAWVKIMVERALIGARRAAVGAG